MGQLLETFKKNTEHAGQILTEMVASVARRQCFRLCPPGALLCHHAAAPAADAEDVTVALRWADRELAPLLTGRHRYRDDQQRREAELVMAGYTTDTNPNPELPA